MRGVRRVFRELEFILSEEQRIVDPQPLKRLPEASGRWSSWLEERGLVGHGAGCGDDGSCLLRSSVTHQVVREDFYLFLLNIAAVLQGKLSCPHFTDGGKRSLPQTKGLTASRKC